MSEMIQQEFDKAFGRGKLKEAVELGRNYAEEKNSDTLPQWKHHKGSLSTLERENRLGLLSYSEYGQRRNQISYAVLELFQLMMEESSSGDQATKTILFLASQPRKHAYLQLEKEYDILCNSLGNNEFNFNTARRENLKTSELREAILEERPMILHFAGHGIAPEHSPQDDYGVIKSRAQEIRGGLYFEDEHGNSVAVRGEALQQFFAAVKSLERVKLVVLNACSTRDLAQAINRHIEFVLGINDEIDDSLAIQFTRSFYNSLAHTNDIRTAYNLAIADLGLTNNTARDQIILFPEQ